MALKFLNDGYFAGKVGIGIESPDRKLHVKDSAIVVSEFEGTNTGSLMDLVNSSSSQLYNGIRFTQGATGKMAITHIADGTTKGYVQIGNSWATGSEILVVDGRTSNVGIGTTSPDLKLDVTHATSGEYVATFQNTGSNLELKLGVTSTGYLNIQGQQINNSATFNMSLQADGGNVGINTTIPTQKLHVVGNARVTGAYYDSNNSPGTANQVLVSTATGTDWVDGSGSSIIGGPYLPLAGNTNATAMTGDIILANQKQVRFLTSGNLVGLRLQSSGTSSFIDNEVGDMYFRQEANGNNIFFQADDGSGGNTTYFSVRPNNGARTQFEKNTRHNDGIKAFFGTSEDLQIYHDGTNSVISDGGVGLLAVRGSEVKIKSPTTTEVFARFIENSSVELYYDGDKKFETTSAGVTVTGTAKATAIEIESTAPSILFEETDVTARWRNRVQTGGYRLQYAANGSTFTDHVSLGANAFTFAKDTTFSGGITVSSPGSSFYTTFKSADDYVIGLKDSANTMQWWLKAYTDGSFALHEDNAGDKFTIAAGGNATFTGLVSGITPVNAANFVTKAYVDGSGGGTGPFLPLAGGTMTGDVRFNDGVEIEVGTSRDLVINHDGSNSYIKQLGTGNLYIRQSVDDGDIIFQNDNGGGGVATYFKLDGNIAKTVFSRDVQFSYNAKALFGNSYDLQIYHDGSHSYISDTGTGDIFIKASNDVFIQGANGEFMAEFSENGSVDLYHNGSKKFETTSTGVTVTGAGIFTSDITSAGLTVDYTGNRTGDAGILVTNDASDWGIKVDKDGTADYGILSQTDGENAIVVRNAAGTTNIQLQGDGDASFAGSLTIPDYIYHTSDPNTFFGFDGNDQIAIKTSGNYNFFGDANATTLYAAGNIKLKTSNVSVGTATTTGGTLIDGWITTTQANAVNNTTIATTAYVNNKIALIPAGLRFEGTWDASTGNPPSASPENGQFWIVSVAGSTSLSGITDWKVGDWAIYVVAGAGTDGWQKIDNSSVLDGFGTGQSVTKWDGSGTSNTLTNGPITFSTSDNNSTFTGDLYIPNKIIHVGDENTWMQFETDVISLRTGGTDRLTLTNSLATFSGTVTVNTSNSGILTLNRTTSAGGYMRFQNDGTDKFYIGSRGTVSGSGGTGYDIYAVGGNDIRFFPGTLLALTLDTSANATFTGDVNITQTTDVGVLNTTNLDNGSAVGLSLTYPTSNVAAGDGLAIAIGIAGRGRSYIANSNITNNLDASNLEFYTEGGGVINKVLTLGAEKEATFAGTVTISKTASGSTTQILNLVNPVGTASTGVRLWMSGTNTTTRGTFIDAVAETTSNDHSLRFGTSAASSAPTEKMRIDSAGNVGIGTTGPTANLHISDTADAVLKIEGDTINSDETKGAKILLITDNGYRTAAITGGNATYETSSGNFNALNLQSKDIRFHTGVAQDYDLAVERMRITGTGALSFGTTGTAYGTSGQVLTSAGNASPTWTTPTTGTVTGGGSNTYLAKWTTANNINSSAMFQAASGNFSIGITTPNAKLSVVNDISIGTSATDVLRLSNISGVGGIYGFGSRNLAFGSITNGEVMRVDNINERVGIGTTGPQSKLQVAGGIQMANDTATASAAKVGTMRYRTGTEYVEVTGTELVTNGDFATDSNWTKETGWSIGSGVASYNGSANNNAIYQSPGLTNGSIYRLSFSVVNYVSGTLIGNLSSGSTTGGTGNITANGDYSFNITATGGLCIFRSTSSFNGSIDNVSLIEVTSEDASYADMCMQTGASTYEWVNIVRNTY